MIAGYSGFFSHMCSQTMSNILLLYLSLEVLGTAIRDRLSLEIFVMVPD
jgi:hypothetical protein